MKIGPYVLNQIYVGDARELAKEIPNDSIDIIFTDPPYDRDSIPLYGWLAETGARILRPNGFLCCMAGGYHLDKVFQQMTGKGLDWYFKIEVFNLGDSPVIWPRRIITRTKPILMWTKGQGIIQIWNMTDVYQGQGKDKRYHQWGQEVGSARYVIEYVLGSGAQGVLLEPFAGGGSTLKACKNLGIDFIAFDIDETAAEAARNNIEGILPPGETEQYLLW